jgi:hypothetical protein
VFVGHDEIHGLRLADFVAVAAVAGEGFAEAGSFERLEMLLLVVLMCKEMGMVYAGTEDVQTRAARRRRNKSQWLRSRWTSRRRHFRREESSWMQTWRSMGGI